jgi:hypothetical protein
MKLIYSEGVPEREDLFSFYDALGWREFLKLDADMLHLAMQNRYFMVRSTQQINW